MEPIREIDNFKHITIEFGFKNGEKTELVFETETAKKVFNLFNIGYDQKTTFEDKDGTYTCGIDFSEVIYFNVIELF